MLVGSGGTEPGEYTLGVGVTVRFTERTVFPTELAGGGVTLGAMFEGVDCGILCGVFGVVPGTGGRPARRFSRFSGFILGDCFSSGTCSLFSFESISRCLPSQMFNLLALLARAKSSL